jgi:uncharacterized iron-regulated membrane protein
MYCGLLISIYAVLIGVSGSILVFRPELTRLARPDLYVGRVTQLAITSPDQVMNWLASASQNGDRSV